MWALKLQTETKLDGVREHLICEPVGVVKLFRTRKDAMLYRKHNYAYIRFRPDLRREPHCWRMPFPVHVTVQEISTPIKQGTRP